MEILLNVLSHFAPAVVDLHQENNQNTNIIRNKTTVVQKKKKIY